jgi:asparagine synthase (glutamine-hydrolysing)
VGDLLIVCGICGIIGTDLKAPVENKRIETMCNSLIHRGPDDSGVFIEHNVGLGHRRLSIVDLEHGHQPMANEDETIWIVYNGEFYNHEDYVLELKSKGHKYKSRSDTETIIHLYEEYGLDVVDFLRGMFAFAIYDKRHKRLVLARDRLGIKPLYYYFEDGNLIWGSEIKSILASGYVKPKLRLQSLPDYLANRYTSGEETLFEGIKRLLPGHVMVWQDGKIRIHRYWDLELGAPDEPASEEEVIDEFKSLFEESVRLRLMSDVPLGMFLSGGIDSSAIAGVMSRMVDQPIKTFSVAFQEREANELHYAKAASQAFGADHHEVIVTPEAFFDKLPKLIWQEDEPIAFPSSIPLYFVSDLARSHVKVVLTGEGSDELLAGYAKYKKTLLNLHLGTIYSRIFPSSLRDRVKALIDRTELNPLVRRKAIRTFLYLEPEIESIYFDNFSVFSKNRIENLLTPQALETLNGIDPYNSNRAYFNRNGHCGLLDRLLYTDMKTYLHELLMKQDQMSMAASIESRVPFLDHKLVEFVARLPHRFKLRGWTTKYILRKSMNGMLPKEILYRKKAGFPVPIRKWFQNGTFLDLPEYLLSDRTLARGFFKKDYVEQLLGSHVSGQDDHSERLWSLLNFEIWQRIFIDGEEMTA